MARCFMTLFSDDPNAADGCETRRAVATPFAYFAHGQLSLCLAQPRRGRAALILYARQPGRSLASASAATDGLLSRDGAHVFCL